MKAWLVTEDGGVYWYMQWLRTSFFIDELKKIERTEQRLESVLKEPINIQIE